MSFVPQRYNAADPDVTTSAMQAALNNKQDTLVSATNIKTVNGSTLLGSGDLVISGGLGSSFTKAQLDTAISDGNAVFVGDALNGTLGATTPAAITCTTLTASGAVDARTATTGHRLGHFGHQDSVTVGWPGSSFGGYQCGSNGIVSWLGMGLSLGANASGVVEVNSGTNVAFGGSLRDLTLRSLTASGTVRLGTYTVATLPSASANTRARAFVTDSNLAFNSTNLGSTVTAGGSTLVPVFSNGTNWVIG